VKKLAKAAAKYKRMISAKAKYGDERIIEAKKGKWRRKSHGW